MLAARWIVMDFTGTDNLAPAGPDAAAFSIDSTSGALRFTNVPDYENPQDADGQRTIEARELLLSSQ